MWEVHRPVETSFIPKLAVIAALATVAIRSGDSHIRGQGRLSLSTSRLVLRSASGDRTATSVNSGVRQDRRMKLALQPCYFPISTGSPRCRACKVAADASDASTRSAPCFRDPRGSNHLTPLASQTLTLSKNWCGRGGFFFFLDVDDSCVSALRRPRKPWPAAPASAIFSREEKKKKGGRRTMDCGPMEIY